MGLPILITVVQTECDRCGSALQPNAAYCDECGLRTLRARRLVRLAIRVELLAVLMVIAVIVAFAYIYIAQK